MNTFDEREKSFEKKFAHDEELQFKVSARRNKYIGQWVEDNMNGQGTFTLADGTIRKGIWENGVLVESN